VIHCRVQHHPSRASLIPGLLERLSPLTVEVVPHASVPPNPWLGYRQCLQNIPDCGHLLIIQDDAVPCLNFAAAVEQVAASNPDAPVSLWLSYHPAGTAGRARQAMIRNKRYVWFGYTKYVYLVAMLWPRRLACDFLEWSATDRDTLRHRADDGVVAKWARETRQEIRVTVPSLVEHPDVVPSVKGGSQKAAAGHDKARVAMLLAEDGLRYQW